MIQWNEIEMRLLILLPYITYMVFLKVYANVYIISVITTILGFLAIYFVPRTVYRGGGDKYKSHTFTLHSPLYANATCHNGIGNNLNHKRKKK